MVAQRYIGASRHFANPAKRPCEPGWMPGNGNPEPFGGGAATTPGGPDDTWIAFRLFPDLLKTFWIFPLMNPSAAIAASEMSAMISAYSTSVCPSSFGRRPESSFAIFMAAVRIWQPSPCF